MRHLITFGPDQHPEERNAAVLVYGEVDAEQARGIALAMFGRDWAGLYHLSEVQNYIDKWHPTVIGRVHVNVPKFDAPQQRS